MPSRQSSVCRAITFTCAPSRIAASKPTPSMWYSKRFERATALALRELSSSRKAVASRLERLGRHHPIHQPVAQGRVRIDRVPERDQLERPLLAYRPPENGHDHRRYETEPYFRIAEARVGPGQHEIARRGESGPSRQRPAMDERHDGFLEAANEDEQIAQGLGFLQARVGTRLHRFLHLAKVGSGAEIRAGARDRDHTHALVGLGRGQRVLQLPRPVPGSGRCAARAGPG